MTKIKGYIGTYTKGESKGIYSFTLHTTKGTIGDMQLVAEVENPTYLSISDDQDTLYSVVQKGALGGIASYAINHADGSLKFINMHMITNATILTIKISIFLTEPFILTSIYSLHRFLSCSYCTLVIMIFLLKYCYLLFTNCSFRIKFRFFFCALFTF